ncbi:MFS transporter [Mariniphaga sediminis]|jgi:sugar porter (SP) family MFS transporter|uniref:MFS transporter n=1 Tax=Mariniphaga sediminis TaxID=1628158 RepID=A0A399CXC2_9BACT|nr:sugar porter family MFS transporter [Mariniphaga sediminis]RIH63122.1 MFS transporter [Mariniphaga sediminis]
MKNTNRIYKWSLIVALGGFLFGFDTAVISGVEKSIQQLFQLNPFWHGFTISSALIGTIIGALTAGKPADKYGRRFLLFIIAALYAISAIGSAIAPFLSLFIVFRFLGGIAVGASSVAGPMYISEISPANMRGRMTGLFQFNVIFGILLAYISNYLLRNTGDEPWRWMLGVEGIPSVIFFLLLFRIPRSPRFLVKINKIDEAREVLNIINNGNTESEIVKIKDGLLKGKTASQVLFSKHYMKPILIAFSVAMFNQLSGINAILYYAPRIFELTGLSIADSMFQPVLIGITNGIFTIVGMIIIDRVGRKKLLIVGSLGMAVCLGLISRTLFIQNFSGYGILVYLLVYIVFFAFSTGAVIWVLISEVFPNSVRGKGQALGSFTHWSFATLITFLFPIFNSTLKGSSYSFAFFSIMMIIQALVVWRYFPETKGRSLEELSEELSN